ncbi:3-oxoacyl-[acyl-carrier-protein] synthase III C-terminal domain-containing protein [Streptomyces sp. NBC_01565]|uniref:3-oxoacyl-ACP synthase III family protein n=1 Tax=unclassified Streptomyces TaxID=2593676 RepID=UPI0022504197|nr:3-oxoacyl-[acyl-carrier-protein] synthase III C-terminal domain-containing protein [Streptomyces sp. NBC_01565]MCX4546089.1 3-oxoacyl-ACP synthase [Streptomyces sp. NBC_01565]
MTAAIATLERVESHLPDRRVTIETLAAPLGLSRAKMALFRKVHGLHTLHQDPATSLLDLLLPAARQALAGLHDPRRIRFVLYAHAIHEVAPAGFDAAAALRDALGLGHAEAFALSQQNCAGGLGAVEVAARLLADGDPADRTLLVIGDKPYSPLIRMVPNTALMGEGAAACLISAEGPGDRVLSHVSRTLGEYARLIGLAPEEAALYGKAYAPVLADVMRGAVREAGLALEDIDLVIPHNVNMLAWRNTIAELGIAAERVFLENIPRYSHCFAADPFVNYTTLRDAGRLVPGRHYLMAGVGAGATFTALALTHRGPLPARPTNLESAR